MHSHQEAKKVGAIKAVATIEELAADIGCDVAELQQTVEQVEKLATGTYSDEFGRDFTAHSPLAPPYYLAKVMGALFHTQGGLEVDSQARVVRSDGTLFPNLFAGGGAARGLSGPADWGYLSGSGLMCATTMGRLAGESAAELVSAKNSPS